MKNITFSADESLIRKGRKKAMQENTTLNERFREWLRGYASGADSKSDYDEIKQKLGYAKPGRTFSRDEMNER